MLNKEVARIEIRNKKAKRIYTTGEVFEADVVVAGSDYHHTEQFLLSEAHRTYDSTYWQSRTMSPSSLLFYVGVNKTLPGLLHHNLFFDARSKSVGAWVGIEYMAQAIAAFEGYHSLQRGEPVQVGFLLGARRFESRCASFALGTVLHISVHGVLQHDNGLGAFECQIADAGDRQVLATATVTVFKPDDVQQFLKSS